MGTDPWINRDPYNDYPSDSEPSMMDKPVAAGHYEPNEDGFAYWTPSGKVSSDGGSTSYYDLPEGAKTLMDLIEAREMGFALGNILKAAYRLGRKDGTDPLYDINKIIFFATRMKEREERLGRLTS